MSVPGKVIVVAPDALRGFAERVLAAVGAPPGHARTVAHSLVEAGLLGHDSHGVMRLPGYIARVRQGVVAPSAPPALASLRVARAPVEANVTGRAVMLAWYCSVKSTAGFARQVTE